jgi:hypothetical protein
LGGNVQPPQFHHAGSAEIDLHGETLG